MQKSSIARIMIESTESEDQAYSALKLVICYSIVARDLIVAIAKSTDHESS